MLIMKSANSEQRKYCGRSPGAAGRILQTSRRQTIAAVSLPLSAAYRGLVVEAAAIQLLFSRVMKKIDLF